MKQHLLLLCMTIIFMSSALAQKNFQTEYQTFRFKLHDLLDEDKPMRISNALSQYIDSFLKDHPKEIPDLRTTQMEEYERARIDDPAEYASIDSNDLEALRELALLIATRETLVEMIENDNASHDGIGYLNGNRDVDNLAVMLKFLSVSPMEVILMTNSRIMPEILNKHLHIPNDQFGRLFGKLGITGAYLSTEQKDKINWLVTVNNYYMINTYSVNVNTGEIRLMQVMVRK